MAKLLDRGAVEQYRGAGYYFPIDVLDEGEVSEPIARRLEAFEASAGPARPRTAAEQVPPPLQVGRRSHAPSRASWTPSRISSGSDILCWNTIFWIKEANSPSFVSWHQDVRYWGLDTSELVTAWLALSPATEAERLHAGAAEEPSRGSVLPHRDEYHDDNLLTRGQEIAVDVDEADAGLDAPCSGTGIAAQRRGCPCLGTQPYR